MFASIKNRKRISVLLITFILNIITINTFSAVVADNDGAAFITKAEFDSLKNNFQSQIDQYNMNIDTKIEHAISSYLTGIKVDATRKNNTILPGDVYMYDNTSASTRMRYVYGPPASIGRIQDVKWSDNASYGNLAMLDIALPTTNHNTSKWWQTKLVIQNIDETKRIAEWKGRMTKAYDEIDLSHVWYSFNDISWGLPAFYIQFTRENRNDNYCYVNTDLFGQLIYNAFFGPSLDSANNSTLRIEINRVLNHWGNIHNENVVLFGNSISYDCFSNYDKNRNWKYKGTSETLYQTVSDTNKNLFAIDGFFDISSSLSVQFANANVVPPPTRVPDDTTKYDLTCKFYQQAYWSTDSGRTGARWYNGDVWRYPMVGFETTYITNWNQLYNSSLDSFAKVMVSNKIKGYGVLMKDSADIYHVPLYAGIPITTTNKDQKVRMDFNVKTYSLNTSASSSNYGVETKSTPTRTFIWAKSSPFTTNDPNSEADLEITGTNVHSASGYGTAYNHGYYITSDSEKITIEGINENNTSVWLKWSTNNKNGGGIVSIPTNVIVETKAD